MTGIFTVSIDFELIWGTVDLFGPARFRNACIVEREVVIDRLLSLFSEFGVSATWCIVGHLFLDRCEAQDGAKHPEIIRPRHKWVAGDWFDADPCGNENDDPLFYGRSLVDKICAARPVQEIGSHSFSHVILGDAGCSAATADSELSKSVALAAARGIQMRSFAFPRNAVGHIGSLARHGFTCYRGPDPVWYDRAGMPAAASRAAHLLEVLAARRPPVVSPEKHPAGVWNVPGSMIYFPSHGLRRLIPASRRTRRAIKGLKAAVDQGKIFHLWFHPTNLADEPARMFEGLRDILKYARELKSNGSLEILTMGEVAARWENSAASDALAADAMVAKPMGESATCAE